MVNRCDWVNKDPLIVEYHDIEWGVPIHNDRSLFEFLILGGMQAGLSWATILRKRENYRAAFDNFYPEKVAKYNDDKIMDLLNNNGIIRNRTKIVSAIENARAFVEIQSDYGSFDTYIWKFVDYKPTKNSWIKFKEIPSYVPKSVEISLNLKKRGFKFVGPIICYAFMQAVGMVNDHTIDCFRHEKL